MEPVRMMNLNLDQMKQAAAAGVTLLNTPGAVNVPSPMAITGIISVLNSLLTAVVNGEVLIVNVPKKKEGDGDTPPEGDGEKKADLKPVETGKQAEK